MSKLVCLDVECLPNYFLIGFKGLNKGKIVTFSIYGDNAKFDSEDIKKIEYILRTTTTFGFNSNKYDMPMIAYALSGARTDQLYKLSMDLINGLAEWQAKDKYEFTYPQSDHFDLIEPAPAVMISLKAYGTRIGSKKLWEFFVDPKEKVDRKTADEIEKYNVNDLDVTIDLYYAIKDRIELREIMREEYKIDLRSKSDAQIAEAVIISELKKRGVTASKPELSSNYKARYKAPDYIKFKTPQLQELVNEIEEISFSLLANGSVKMPEKLANKKIVIGNTTYKMGIGGLHSQEKSLAVTSNETHVMRNADFASYYPSIILERKLFPKHLGEKFLAIYGKIRDERLYAKRKVEELENELKATLSQTRGID